MATESSSNSPPDQFPGPPSDPSTDLSPDQFSGPTPDQFPVTPSAPPSDPPSYCYLLANSYPPHKNRTYNGYTTNIKRRIKQHNSLLSGGAKYTKKFGNQSWEYIVIISGYESKIQAMKHEWKIKHPDNKKYRNFKYNSPEGRVLGIYEIIKRDGQGNLKIMVKKQYAELLGDLDIIIIDGEMEEWSVTGDMVTDALEHHINQSLDPQ